MSKTNHLAHWEGSDRAETARINGAKEEIRNGVAYIQCMHASPRHGGTACANLLPLSRNGVFEGKCGSCGWIGVKRAWWLSQRQLEFRANRQAIRLKVMNGERISLEEFDFVAREFL
jgi:hypothetical protein